MSHRLWRLALPLAHAEGVPHSVLHSVSFPQETMVTWVTLRHFLSFHAFVIFIRFFFLFSFIFISVLALGYWYKWNMSTLSAIGNKMEKSDAGWKLNKKPIGTTWQPISKMQHRGRNTGSLSDSQETEWMVQVDQWQHQDGSFVRLADEHLQRWREHFQQLLNHDPLHRLAAKPPRVGPVDRWSASHRTLIEEWKGTWLGPHGGWNNQGRWKSSTRPSPHTHESNLAMLTNPINLEEICNCTHLQERQQSWM